jgi:hypothetical protein
MEPPRQLSPDTVASACDADVFPESFMACSYLRPRKHEFPDFKAGCLLPDLPWISQQLLPCRTQDQHTCHLSIHKILWMMGIHALRTMTLRAYDVRESFSESRCG